jgi:hypothetical protein
MPLYILTKADDPADTSDVMLISASLTFHVVVDLITEVIPCFNPIFRGNKPSRHFETHVHDHLTLRIIEEENAATKLMVTTDDPSNMIMRDAYFSMVVDRLEQSVGFVPL